MTRNPSTTLIAVEPAVQEFVAIIDWAWGKTAAAYVETGQYVVQARGELDRDHYKVRITCQLAQYLLHQQNLCIVIDAGTKIVIGKTP